MKTMISRSVIFILLCFLLMSFFVFLTNNNFSFNNFYSVTIYIILEEKGLVIFLSQFLFILLTKNKSVSNIIINIVICWLLYNLIYNLQIDYSFTPKINVENELYIFREYLNENKFNILNISIIQKIISDVQSWQLVDYSPISSFIILLFCGSTEFFIDRFFRHNYIILVVLILLIFLFMLYIWNYSYNLPLFILSIVLFKWRSKNV